MDALVSVVTAVYKAEAYLPQCIESILGQSYQALELILVDDGSPDRCPEICDGYARKDPRIKVIHQPNRGAIHARNAGIDAATGSYILFVDSDDWIDTDLISNVMALAPFSVALFGCTQTSADGQILSTASATAAPRTFTIANDSDTMGSLIQGSLFGYACNKIYHHEVIGEARFEPWRDREDLTFNLEVFQGVTELTLSPETGYYYRQHGGSSLHIAYNCPVPNYVETTKTILDRFSKSLIPSSKRWANLTAKTYLLDAIFRYIKKNSYLSQTDRKKELARLFSDPHIQQGLSLRHNTCKMQLFFSLCFKLRLTALYYHIGVK